MSKMITLVKVDKSGVGLGDNFKSPFLTFI